jgi:(R,R)-butanediol dehydrogenase/meso-butanediol dehydrogenase/diacetyl reductase
VLAVVERISGAGRIVITAVVPDRLAKARELGFTAVIDVAFDCACVQPTLDSALGVTKNNGTLMAVAIFGRPITLPLVLLTAKGINLKTTLAYANNFPQTISLIDRHQDQFRPLTRM